MVFFIKETSQGFLFHVQAWKQAFNEKLQTKSYDTLLRKLKNSLKLKGVK